MVTKPLLQTFLMILYSSPQDAHGNQFGQTVKDKSQDYRLIVGYQYQENTVLRFKRKINTCDGEDLAITVSLNDRNMTTLIH